MRNGYRLCFGHLGFNMGYPVDDMIHIVDNTTPGRLQRFEGGSICPEFGDMDNNGVFVEHSVLDHSNGFVWQGHP